MARTKAEAKAQAKALKAQQAESDSDYGEPDFDSTVNEHFTTPPSTKSHTTKGSTARPKTPMSLRRNPSPSKQATPGIIAAIAARKRLPLTTLEELAPTGQSRSVAAAPSSPSSNRCSYSRGQSSREASIDDSRAASVDGITLHPEFDHYPQYSRGREATSNYSHSRHGSSEPGFNSVFRGASVVTSVGDIARPRSSASNAASNYSQHSSGQGGFHNPIPNTSFYQGHSNVLPHSGTGPSFHPGPRPPSVASDGSSLHNQGHNPSANPIFHQNNPEYHRYHGATANGPMPLPPPPVQPRSEVPSVRSSKSSNKSDTAVEEEQLHSLSDDNDDDDDDEENSDSDGERKGRRGRVSDSVKGEIDSLISSFNQACLEMTKKYELASNYISRRMHPNPRGPKRWNQLQSMLKQSEAERKKWIKGYKPGTTISRKQFSAAYKSFMAGMGTDEADLYFQIHNRRAALDPDQSRQSRHRTFLNATKAMQRIATQMEASVGMNTILISVGDTMEEDHSLVAHYVSEPLQEHFVETWGKSAAEMASHVKAGLYHTVSKEVLIEDMRLRVTAYDAAKKVKTESREVTATNAFTGSSSDKDLENMIRAAFIAQAEHTGLSWPTNVVLWTDMPKKNVIAGVQIVGWPHGMRIPGEFPECVSGKKKSGFAHALKRNDKLVMKAAFEDPEHPLEFRRLETSVERQVLTSSSALKDGLAPWLVFAPPPHDSNQLKAKRLFYPDRQDFEGPERLPPPAAPVSRKAKGGSAVADAGPGPKKEKKMVSIKPKKQSKSSRRDPLDDIDEAMEQESYGTSSSGDDNFVDRSPVNLRSRTVKVEPAQVEDEDPVSPRPSKKRPREDSVGPETMRTKRGRASAGDGITTPLPIESAAHPIAQDQNLRPVPPVQQQTTASTFPQSGPASNSQGNAASFNNQNSAPAYSGQTLPDQHGASFNAPPSYHNRNTTPSYPGQPAPFQNPNGGPGFAPSFQTPNSNSFPMQNGGASFHQGGPSFNAQTGPGFPGQNASGSSFAPQNNGPSFGHGQNQNSAPSFNPYHHGPPSFNGPANMAVDPSQLHQQPGFGGQYPGYHAPGNQSGQPNWNQPNSSNGQSSGAPHSSSGYNPYQGGYQGAPQNGYTGLAQTGEAAPST
ncbi:hypothetical protein C8J56DRAFT_904168 [Mycena floridula]|nr:hypothetical protein C8J56DRAFT_904168 [Mycena floridula]